MPDQDRYRSLLNAGVPEYAARLLASQNVQDVTPTITGPQLLTFIADETLDAIEFAEGTYRLAAMIVNVERKRPLVLRPAPGATVVFAGTLTGTGGQFYFGLGGVASNIELSDVTFSGYSVNQTGILWVGNFHHWKLNRIKIRNATASVSAATSWGLYVSHDNNVGASDGEADGWDFDGSNRQISAWQVTGAPLKTNIRIRDWVQTGPAYAGYVSSNATNLFISGHVITNGGLAGDAMYFENISGGSVTGVFRNNRATLSDGLRNLSSLTDGGGNTFSGTAQPLYLLDQSTQAPGTTLPGTGGLQGDGDKSSTIANTNKAMTLTPGLGQQGYSIATLATVSTQNLRMARFILDRPLLAQTIAAQNIRFHGGISQDNADANARLAFQLFVWRPSTGVKVGNLVTGPRDANAITDTVEHALATNTFTSSALAVLNGDLLVLEVWINAAQGSAAIRNDTIWFSGAQRDSAVDNAAYLDIPSGLLLG